MTKMRLADYILSTVADAGISHAFLVTGGMAMHLNDALAGESRLVPVCHHHEQAAAYAAEGYGHVTGRPALLMVTAGPGAINAMSGVFGAYVDSIPMVVLSGQCKRETTRARYGMDAMRQLGEQEADVVTMAKPITKYVQRVNDPERIAFELGKALHRAVSGRPGPVWLEIPVDVQDCMIDPDILPRYCAPSVPVPDASALMKDIMPRLASAERPLLVVGPDVRQPGMADLFRRAAELLGIPVVSAGAQDTLLNDHPLYAGSMGTVGTRAGNIAVQNADCILCIGMRPYLGLVTYNWRHIGENAHKIVVDEDPFEFEKPCQIADQGIVCEQKYFLSALAEAAKTYDAKRLEPWRAWCRERLALLPAVDPATRRVTAKGQINPYWFVETLYAMLRRDDVIVASNASSSVVPLQVGLLRFGQRFFSNHGNGAMGFALPAAIGACMAAPGRRVICLEGDGSIMMNLQELQTIAHHRLPVLIVIFNNDGYLSIKQTQKNFFRRAIGADADSGTSLPDFTRVAAAFDIPALRIEGKDFAAQLTEALAQSGPLLLDVMLDPDQAFEPKVAARRLPDGTMVSSPPEDMFPFLEPEELALHMSISRKGL